MLSLPPWSQRLSRPAGADLDDCGPDRPRLPGDHGRAGGPAGHPPERVALGDPGEVSRVDTNSRLLTKAALIIAVLSLLLGAVVVINTMAMAMIERRTEFGVLAAVGWTRGRIARLILGETVAVGLGGALVGLGLGALASELLRPSARRGRVRLWQVICVPLLTAINRS